ncbi:MAG: PxKF domain-containing protein [Dehalococcoidia bacterium]|nr:PxKF domain-containing protein [Dehalococcoidia bacterium]
MADDVYVTGNAIVLVGGTRTVTIPAGGSATVSYYIVARPQSQDGQQGCNASDGSPATLRFYVGSQQLGTSTTPVRVDPDQLTFTACRQGNNFNDKSATFSSNTPGTYVVTVEVNDSGPGSYDISQASFTLIVQPPPDTTPPVITPTVSGTLGANGWYVSNVTVTWTVTDPESSITSTSGCGTTTITTDTAGVTLTCTATSAGGTNSASVTIKRDATPPLVNCTPPANAVWYADNVSVPCTASDGGSGLANPADASFTLATSVAPGQETAAATTDSRTVTDQAGNSAPAGPYTFRVDRKAPTVTLSCPTAPVPQYATASATWTASDGGSGVAGPASGQTPLDTSQAGTRTLTLPAGFVRDNAGNASAPVSCTYQVAPQWQWRGFFPPVDNPPVWNVVKAGSAVPIKFSLGGYYGMDILNGAPRVQFVPCSPGPSDVISEAEASTAGNSGLQYDATSGQYIYVWKTEKSWGNRCARLVVTLRDGTSREALFRFTR